ncbi:MAG: hypothetical protein K9W44_14485 [Candidatus Lokiarchaeota archaeon]|nr:hypothetical protein [Candidatus Harpocratesius repetitus]
MNIEIAPGKPGDDPPFNTGSVLHIRIKILDIEYQSLLMKDREVSFGFSLFWLIFQNLKMIKKFFNSFT